MIYEIYGILNCGCEMIFAVMVAICAITYESLKKFRTTDYYTVIPLHSLSGTIHNDYVMKIIV